MVRLILVTAITLVMALVPTCSAYAGFEIGKNDRYQSIGHLGTMHYYLSIESVFWLQNARGPVVTVEIGIMEAERVDRHKTKYRFVDKHMKDFLYDRSECFWFVKEMNQSGENYYWRKLSNSDSDNIMKKAIALAMVETLGSNASEVF